MSVLSAPLGEALKAHGLMLATAESCTGGCVAQALTDVAGSSAWFERGFVTYSNLSKIEMLGVEPETLACHGAVSEATVREMVSGALARSRADCALSVSGIAGPTGGTAEKPVGTVWFAWGMRGGEIRAQHYCLSGSRSDVRRQAVEIALEGVMQQLKSFSMPA